MLAGRGLERLSGAKLGTDEKKKSLRIAERNKAARHVREGLKKKEKRKKEKELEEAKNVGNYHPTIKRLFRGSENSKSSRKKRERGLKMGVGKFRKGTLMLPKSLFK